MKRNICNFSVRVLDKLHNKWELPRSTFFNKHMEIRQKGGWTQKWGDTRVKN